MNKAVLVGNLAKDPEITTTSSGITKCNFTVAVQRRFANAQGVREADFIPCVAWRQTADFIHKYFIKGNKIALDGSIQTRTYDAQDGSKRYVTEVIVDNAEFVTPKADAQNYAPQLNINQPAPQRPEQTRIDTRRFTPADDEELPF